MRSANSSTSWRHDRHETERDDTTRSSKRPLHDTMKITKIDCHVLVQETYDVAATSSAQDDIVVEIHTDEGISGIGETDVNPWIAKACITAPGTHTMGLGLTEMLIGEDPLQVESLWERLYVGSAMNGRRGALVNAIGALDMALHDLRGKALGRPCYELLGGQRQATVTPYASLQPEAASFEAYRDSLVNWARRATARGFRAVKTEVTLAGPYAHKGLNESHERMTETLYAVRDAIGSDIELLVDVQYAFASADEALGVLKDWRDLDLFVEMPLGPTIRSATVGLPRSRRSRLPPASGSRRASSS